MAGEIDLLLKLDDALYARLQARAEAAGRPVDELVREVLLTNIGRPYRPTPEHADRVLRPMVKLDLRT